MIFNFLIFILLLTKVLSIIGREDSDISQLNNVNPGLRVATQSAKSLAERYSYYQERKKHDPPKIWYKKIDLNSDGSAEELIIKSFPGFPGDQDTEILINSELALKEVGYFFDLNIHQIRNKQIIELQLLTGQSANSLFYIYHNKQLTRIPVSTENPPSWYGIISRHKPEFRDINHDGELELLAYYYFLGDKTKKVEIYEFKNLSFVKIDEYQELI